MRLSMTSTGCQPKRAVGILLHLHAKLAIEMALLDVALLARRFIENMAAVLCRVWRLVIHQHATVLRRT